MREIISAGVGFVIAVLLCSLYYPTEVPCPQETALVGVNCEGPSYVAVAYAEDNLPVCESIEMHYIR